ncbi:hypothetical protein TrCOL_g2288 [Triparma columacea]|uniref:SecA family profile domain-containing protein n=1 Tax=Triparma columacea TaxID=722753 RepID=A0A9W7G0A0_9STRA|nr:hypothetical protein TrCOL_g2288 [Triparma columacea]
MAAKKEGDSLPCHLGLCHLGLGAVNYLDGPSPSSPWSLDAPARVALGLACYKLGQIDRAKACFDRAIEMDAGLTAGVVGRVNGQVLNFLGVTTGLIQGGMAEDERRKQYDNDVVRVSNQEIGFDYLRDHLSMSKEGVVLGDSIFIDEARTPLIISESVDADGTKFTNAKILARRNYKDVVFKTRRAADEALAKEVVAAGGRPVLVGTTSVEQSERIVARLEEEGIVAELLNADAKNAPRESEIVAQVGRVGRVTEVKDGEGVGCVEDVGDGGETGSGGDKGSVQASDASESYESATEDEISAWVECLTTSGSAESNEIPSDAQASSDSAHSVDSASSIRRVKSIKEEMLEEARAKYTKAVAEKAKIVIKKPELEFKFKVKDRVEARFHGWKPCGPDMRVYKTVTIVTIIMSVPRFCNTGYTRE